MRRYLKGILKSLVIIIVAGVAAYSLFFSPVPVKTVKVVEGSIIAEAMGTGTLEAHIRAAISPKISGRIARIHVDQGDRVSKGQILVTLDDEDILQQVEMAKAELALAQAGVERAQAQINRTEAITKNARVTYSRYSKLTDSQAVSVKDIDKAREEMEVSEAELHREQTSKIEAEKQVARAQAAVQYYQERLADTQIEAPFDGLILSRTRDPGDIAVPGAIVLDMVYLDPLWISAWVDETLLDNLKLGQPCRIIFRSNPDSQLRGAVARISPQADRETREVQVDVIVDQLPDTWAIGQRAEVFIELDRRENTQIVPQETMVWRQDRPGVFYVEGKKARWTQVQLGLQGQGKVEVVQGLQTGQDIIVPGLKLPREGRAVRIEP